MMDLAPHARRPWWRRAFLWEVPFLALLGGFMFWVRMLPYKALVGSGRSYFIGTDPFYHYRETLGIVRAFPRVPRWDPWTFYPIGTGTGQFGSLFDWVCAAFVVLTQGRNASEAYVQQVLGVYPAVLGAILVVPFFFLAKKLLGTPGAIVASVTIALLPGEFLIRSVAGYSDHHVAEAVTSLLGLLGVFVAATKGHALRDRIARHRESSAWRSIIAWGVLGGVALAINFYTWQPAILFAAILTLWLTVVILIEDGAGGDGLGYAVGAAIAFVTTGLLMLPVVEQFNITEFNTYSLMHPVASFAAAAWVLCVHFAARSTKRHHISPWAVPSVVVGAALVGYAMIVAFLADLYASILWGMSWITGFGVRRTTFTIAEARPAEFFCSNDGQHSCLQNDFGAAAVFALFILAGLFVWVLWKRRPADILLLIWSIVIVQATRTQIRFSYYLALVIAMLIGWLAARISEWSGLEAALNGEATKAVPSKGRKTRRVETTASKVQAWQPFAVAAALLLVLPGNVFASDNSYPGWKRADIRGADGDLVLWMEGLDWMRSHTPDAGVDLGVVTPQPPRGQLYDYPPQTYGVLTWWDYGHWIETIAQRPPVANPFQQAAPFAATYFTERDPSVAEKRLDDWVQGKGPIRYVFIDDEIATGKWGAITVWAHSQNASRDQWADGEFIVKTSYDTGSGQRQDLYTTGPEWTQSMMGRLYDNDANGLSHYRLVWEATTYEAIGSASGSDGGLRCLHDVLSGRCGVSLSSTQVFSYQPGTALAMGDGTRVYDVFLASRLKLFERVEGAHLVGSAPPGSTVTANARIAAQPETTPARQPFDFQVSGVAGADGKFDIVFPYSNVDPIAPKDGGTDLSAHVTGPIVVTWPGGGSRVDVPDAAVLRGGIVQVPAG
ncbi:MAG: oligosaccharyl transferase, archaeosortase A system-associated [Candidatus Thermoplasmatota archaeon]